MVINEFMQQLGYIKFEFISHPYVGVDVKPIRKTYFFSPSTDINRFKNILFFHGKFSKNSPYEEFEQFLEEIGEQSFVVGGGEDE